MSTYKWQGGGIPFGYAYDKEKKILLPNPQEVQTLQKIFKLAINGYGSKKIANELNNSNIPSRIGSKWTTGAIEFMLSPSRLQFYIGYEPKSGKRGNWKPILPKSVYDRLHVKERQTDIRKTKKEREEYLLSGHGSFFVCGYCGGTVKASVTIKQNQKLKYYLCSRKQTQGNSQCPESKLVQQRIIDQLVITNLKIQLSKTFAIKKFVTALREQKQKELQLLLNTHISRVHKIISKPNLSEADIRALSSSLDLHDQLENFYYYFSGDILPVVDKKSKKDLVLRNIAEIILYKNYFDIRYRFPVNDKLDFTKRIVINEDTK